MTVQEARLREGDNDYLYDAASIGPRELFGLFVAGPQAAANLLAGGRGSTRVAQHGGREYVVRHYRRGGALARVSGDRYLWSGNVRSRPWREWRLLASMQAQELPVPRPLAVRLIRRGLIYRADLATERLPGQTLAQALAQQPLAESRWRDLGALIWRFHAAGICHADLNANNVMVDPGANAAWLIDFDKASRRAPRQDWQLGNLARLKRSLLKLSALTPALNFSEHEWHCLFGAYSKASNSSPSSACSRVK